MKEFAPVARAHATPAPPRLRVGSHLDPVERDADRMADAVMRGGVVDAPGRAPGAVVRRACRACEDDDAKRVRRSARGPDRDEAEAPASVRNVLASSGRPLEPAVRAFMEPRFGFDFSAVRVHDDGAADRSADAIAADAYSFGEHVVFARGRYAPHSGSGLRLLAHELGHVVQGAGPQAGAAVHRQRAARSGRVPTHTEACDSSESNPVVWFQFDSTRPRRDAEVDSTVHLTSLVARVRQHFADVGPDAALELHGFASEEGTPDHNLDLSARRAQFVRDVLVYAGVPADRIRAVGLGETTSMPGRPWNRRVEICLTPTVEHIDMEEETVRTGVDCANPPAGGVSSLTEYALLVACVERALPTLGPRDILSVLRQTYYRGGHWPEVIRCGTSAGAGGVATLRRDHPALYRALTDSKVTDGVDVGHVFTGLEAMVCPTASVELEVLGPNPVVAMSNEDFATWGGDLGQAAAMRTHDEIDNGVRHGASHYFGTAGSAASYEDLRGDIDAYVLRSGLAGRCAGSRGTALLALASPISRQLLEYYGDASSPGVSDRFRCFIEAIGGIISGGRITNKLTLAGAMEPSVESFARIYYLSLVSVPLFAIGPVEAIKLYAYAQEFSTRFVSWLESRL